MVDIPIILIFPNRCCLLGISRDGSTQNYNLHMLFGLCLVMTPHRSYNLPEHHQQATVDRIDCYVLKTIPQLIFLVNVNNQYKLIPFQVTQRVPSNYQFVLSSSPYYLPFGLNILYNSGWLFEQTTW